VESAIREYVGIVLSNSVYPEAFPVDYDHDFDLGTRELRLAVTVPPPSAVSVVKEYKYVKAKDEISSTVLPVKAQKDRYAGAVTQVALRTLHEIFEADRGGKIHSIALTVGTEALSPATGLRETVPLVIVGADRETFTRFDLSNVVPQATLEHLGAAVSKSPFDLMSADTSRGVRVRKG
jgi:restriction system protein